MSQPIQNSLREQALAMVVAARDNQVNKHGYTSEHDLNHDRDELAIAAACYALPADKRDNTYITNLPVKWPFEAEYWKPTPFDRLKELSKAGALILAEIERTLAEINKQVA